MNELRRRRIVWILGMLFLGSLGLAAWQRHRILGMYYFTALRNASLQIENLVEDSELSLGEQYALSRYMDSLSQSELSGKAKSTLILVLDDYVRDSVGTALDSSFALSISQPQQDSKDEDRVLFYKSDKRTFSRQAADDLRIKIAYEVASRLDANKLRADDHALSFIASHCWAKRRSRVDANNRPIETAPFQLIFSRVRTIPLR